MDIVAPFIILMQGRPRRRILETTGQPASLVKSASFQVPVRDLSQKKQSGQLLKKNTQDCSLAFTVMHTHACIPTHICMHVHTHMYLNIPA